jgi:hydroxymethylbilane synthase
MGGFGVFTREVQKAVLDGRADVAVHSLKDLPTDPVEGLVLGAVPERGPLFDVLVLPANTSDRPHETRSDPLAILPRDARVGTGSLRRRAQLLHVRPDLKLLDVRGNVETRLRKLDAGEYDALVLAAAGLERLGFADRISAGLGPPLLFPAVGQGALGLECRTDDTATRAALAALDHPATRTAVAAERALLAALRAGCHAPVGVLAERRGETLRLSSVVLSPDGRRRIAAEADGAAASPEQVGRAVAERLRDLGAGELVAAAASTD